MFSLFDVDKFVWCMVVSFTFSHIYVTFAHFIRETPQLGEGGCPVGLTGVTVTRRLITSLLVLL